MLNNFMLASIQSHRLGDLPHHVYHLIVGNYVAWVGPSIQMSQLDVVNAAKDALKQENSNNYIHLKRL